MWIQILGTMKLRRPVMRYVQPDQRPLAEAFPRHTNSFFHT